MSVGSAAAWPVIQVHDRRILRQDQGGIQLLASAISHVSIGRSYRNLIDFGKLSVVSRETGTRAYFPVHAPQVHSLFPSCFSSIFVRRGSARKDVASRIARERKKKKMIWEQAQLHAILYNVVVRRIRNGCSRIYELELRVSRIPARRVLHFSAAAPAARGSKLFSLLDTRTVLPFILFFFFFSPTQSIFHS